MEFLAEYALFFAKVATFVVALLIVVAAVFSASHKMEGDSGGKLEVRKLNDRYGLMEDTIRAAVLDDKALKEHEKQKKRDEKKASKEKSASQKSKKGNVSDAESDAKQVFVLDFDGDMKASAVDNFREEITAVLTLAKSSDEVVIRLESPGGMVHAYGLAASQLARFKSAGIPMTVCVDKVAASGGYMMACIADKLLAAPFAVIGSIGVVASIPNFNKVLKKNDVDYELLTAGEYKRTLTMLGENTEAGKNKFIEDLEETHELFKGFVGEYRPQLDVPSVATGETWYGKRALDKQLVDEIRTSDEYITSLAKDANVFQVKYVEKKSWQEKLGVAAEAAFENAADRLLTRGVRSWETRH